MKKHYAMYFTRLVYSLVCMCIIFPALTQTMRVGSGTVMTIPSGFCLTVDNIVNDGTVHVQSTHQGDGGIINNTNGSTSGIYKVDRYLTPGMWHFISSPITNAYGEVASGTSSGRWLMPYQESTNSWASYITNPNMSMHVGHGYAIWSNTTFTRSFQGVINVGAVGPLQIALTGEPSPKSGFNLLGNPYPCPIDWEAVSGWTKNSIGNMIYLFDGTISQYATYVNGVSTNGGSRYIAMGQSFFVQASNSNANITVNNAVRTFNTSACPFYTSFKNTQEVEKISLIVKGNSLSDESVLYLKESTQSHFDYDNDAMKLYGSSEAPQLYTYKGEYMTAVHSVNHWEQIPGKEVFLETGMHGQYVFEYNVEQVSIGNQYVILDKLTGNLVLPNTNYEFTSNPTDPKNRFVFIVSNPASIEDGNDNTNISETILAYISDNIFYIITDSELKSAEIYSVHGTLVMSTNKHITDMNTLSKGIYVAHIQTNKGIKVTKISIN